ncbi:MAG: putative lipid II flippase FtsW [Candidatus Babeliales bacterium]
MALQDDLLQRDIRRFVATVGVLTLVGFIFIYSSSSIYALEKFGSDYFFLKKQLIYFIPSLAGMMLFARVPMTFWKRWAPWFFLAALGLTALTLVPKLGLKCHGSNRWINLGILSFQPSEMLKLFLFIYFGFFLERKLYSIKSFIHSYLPFLVVLGLTFAVLLKQPDFGSVVTIMTTSLVLFFVAEFKIGHLIGTLLVALPGMVWLVMTKAYRLQRILIFINPWADPQGKGFQIIQSLIAIGSGHWWGLGLAESKQKFFYLPMQHTDFIFPIIAEETGFIGAVALAGLFLMFCYFGLRVALSLADPFAFFSTLGFVVFITLQAVINIMVTVGLLPTKGLGLPFVSYGGTALISFFCMVGFIINAARSQRRGYN